MPGEGFEPPTFGLQNRCTTTVLTRRAAFSSIMSRAFVQPPSPGEAHSHRASIGGLVGHASPPYTARHRCGAIAQLGERLNGIQEVVGSIPIGSTSFPLFLLGFDIRLGYPGTTR